MTPALIYGALVLAAGLGFALGRLTARKRVVEKLVYSPLSVRRGPGGRFEKVS
jgi:hypothetical protein